MISASTRSLPQPRRPANSRHEFHEFAPIAAGVAAAAKTAAEISGELFRQQLPQHERQNPAVPVIIDLDWRIDSHLHWEIARLPVRRFEFDRELLAWLQVVRQTVDRKCLRSIDAE
jgi:hypothetical protein